MGLESVVAACFEFRSYVNCRELLPLSGETFSSWASMSKSSSASSSLK